MRNLSDDVMDKAKHRNRASYTLATLLLTLVVLTWFIGWRHPLPIWFTPPHNGYTPLLYIAFSFVWIPAAYLLVRHLHWQQLTILLTLAGCLSSVCYIGWWVFITFLITDSPSYNFTNCTSPSEAELVCTQPYYAYGENIYRFKVLSPALPLMLLQNEELIWEEVPVTPTQDNMQNK
jgi:hypothetical protein